MYFLYLINEIQLTKLFNLIQIQYGDKSGSINLMDVLIYVRFRAINIFSSSKLNNKIVEIMTFMIMDYQLIP